MCRVVLLLALAACGRVGFRDVGDDAATGDVGPDANPLNLLVRYSMDNDPSTTAIPASRPEYNATCTVCPTATPGHLGGAYDFDGTANFTLPVRQHIGTQSYTVAVWIRAMAVGADMSVVNKRVGPASGFDVFNIFVGGNDGGVSYETTEGATYEYIDIGLEDVRGTWHHIAASWDGTTKRIYVDGMLRGAAAATLLDSTEDVMVGVDRDSDAPVFPYKGAIDELEFYGRALTDPEVAQIAAR